jgi:hypothetical protein
LTYSDELDTALILPGWSNLDKVFSKAYSSGDQEQLLDLLMAYRLATSVRVYPTLWRLSLLLSSRAWDPQQDIKVWEEDRSLKLFACELDIEVYSRLDFSTHGFSTVAIDSQRHNVHLECLLGEDISKPRLPAGYIIRSVQGRDEQVAYGRLYSCARVSAEQRQEMMESDEYGHLVVVDPIGNSVAFCEYSISREEWESRAERVG